eukprot:GHVQ01021787.1.p1 GENE.GHVQ01021787.1~~GHVQ01021787.1.p1  ORF type:complete len:556 (+),score=66.62 GHVQ01021787.1:139-1806(+)
MYGDQRGVEHSPFMTSQGGPIGGMEVSASAHRDSGSYRGQQYMQHNRVDYSEYEDGPIVFGSWRVGHLKRCGLRGLTIGVIALVFIGLLMVTRNAKKHIIGGPGSGEAEGGYGGVFEEMQLVQGKSLPQVCVQWLRERDENSAGKRVRGDGSGSMKRRQKPDEEPIPLASRVKLISPPLASLLTAAQLNSSGSPPTSPNSPSLTPDSSTVSTTPAATSPSSPAIFSNPLISSSGESTAAEERRYLVPHDVGLVFRGPFPFNVRTGAFRYLELRQALERAMTLEATEADLVADSSEQGRQGEGRSLSATDKIVKETVALPTRFTIRLISLLNPDVNEHEKCMTSLVEMYKADISVISQSPVVLENEVLMWPMSGLSHAVGDPFLITTDAEKDDMLQEYEQRIDFNDHLVNRTEQVHAFGLNPRSPRIEHARNKGVQQDEDSFVVTYVFDNQGEDRTGVLDGAYNLRYSGEAPNLKDVWTDLQFAGAKPDTKWQYELEWFCMGLDRGHITAPSRDTAHPLACVDLNAQARREQNKNLPALTSVQPSSHSADATTGDL